MNFAIPRPALLLGLAGLLPLVYGAVGTYLPALVLPFAPPLMVMELYGSIIFAYMSGVLWGFVCAGGKAGGRAGWRWLALSAAPALAMFLIVMIDPGEMVSILTFAFPALLPFDYLFWRAKLAPRWWLTLRVLLTVAASACFWFAASGAGMAL